jgi:hypothetical protein
VRASGGGRIVPSGALLAMSPMVESPLVAAMAAVVCAVESRVCL